MQRPYLLCALLGGLLTATNAVSAPPTSQAIRASVQKSLGLLERAADEFIVHRDCFSCHHQALPVMALTMAKEKGYAIKEEVLTRQIQHTARFFDNNRKKFLEKAGTGGGVDTAGYGLLTLQTGGQAANPTTDAVIEYLLHRVKGNNYFACSSERPPAEVSSITTTYLGLNGLKHYGSQAKQKEIEEARERIRVWLRSQPSGDTEDRVFRLKILDLLAAQPNEKAAAIRSLLRIQREDGGWPQNEWMESDAYATGSVLVTLRQLRALEPADPAYERAVKWLIRDQLADGSWKVESWSKPFQLYFESGFPHGKDQWISCTATSWAAMALMQAAQDLDKVGKK